MSLVQNLKDQAQLKSTAPKLADVITGTAKVIEDEADTANKSTDTASLGDVNADSTIEASGTDEDFDAFSKRTKESLVDEVKKARDKEAEKRIKHKKQMEESQKLFDTERQQLQAQLEEFKAKAQEIEGLKTKQADDSIDVAEKLKTREKALEKLQSDNESLMKRLDSIERDRKAKEEAEAEDKRIKEGVILKRFDDELKSIPEDKQKFARNMFKGADTLEEGYFAVLEAKREGLFGKKKVEVVHKTMNADTAKIQTDNNKQPLKSRDKIRNGLRAKLKDGLTPGHRL